MIPIKKYKRNTLLFLNILLLLVLMTAACAVNNVDEEGKILEMYAQSMRAFAHEDLRGVMKNISKDFRSSFESQQNYEEVSEFRRLFILNNSNVSIDFRDINIEVNNSKAIVKLKVYIHTDQIETNWAEIDTLRKKRGTWEIVSWNILGGF
ncbi:hypothetical protein AMJ80_00280 [bacterium SM23_31]|nr:MAG: hypothetical protein AMJ80_00280 [bacterium SM23_31]